MNAVATQLKPRARRIAADEAHAWARNLRLKNPYAKLVLTMTTLYVQSDGTCFVGIKALSDDCELSEDTVRRRLGWLETVGAITRMPQWLDENGRRNSDGRGKRTTDEIRLMFDIDPDVVEARAAGDLDAGNEAEADEISPRQQPGLTEPGHAISPSHGQGLTDSKNLPQPSVSPLPALAVRPGPNDSEPEPESTPPTPLQGGGADLSGRENETKTWPHAETWSRFETAWREPIIAQQLCRQIWMAFTDGDRETAIRVARGYGVWLAKQKRPPNRCNAQKLLREREAWTQFADLAGPDPALRTFVVKDSPAHRAVVVLAKIGGWLPPEINFDPSQSADGYWRERPPPADLIGLSAFADVTDALWIDLDKNSVPFKAWAARIHSWLGRWPNMLRVPCQFPPRKDGSINTGDVPLATDQELKDFGKTG